MVLNIILSILIWLLLIIPWLLSVLPSLMVLLWMILLLFSKFVYVYTSQKFSSLFKNSFFNKKENATLIYSLLFPLSLSLSHVLYPLSTNAFSIIFFFSFPKLLLFPKKSFFSFSSSNIYFLSLLSHSYNY